MPHSFSNCPLRSCALLITHHQTQSIVTATDDMLDLLGYQLADLIGHSVHHALQIQLSSNLTLDIPECSLRHAKGYTVYCQICIHQNPLNSYHCLDYWLIRLQEPSVSTWSSSLSILRLSAYGTIEQVSHATSLPQSTAELMGRPVMAFVYQDDVQSLCARLSYPTYTSPMFIRWSRLPCLMSASAKEIQESVYYDWVAFSVDVGNLYRPVCLIRPLQITRDDTEENSMALADHLLTAWWIQYQPLLSQYYYQTRTYVSEFYQYFSHYWSDRIHTLQTVLKQDYNTFFQLLQKINLFVTQDTLST
ncbi:hypothetical protein BD560DRAFT_386115 [Blakeslea trispora]|nr:hypothetical protein BD560DRAFT_386115 [Blakeslea trispora]